MQDLFPQFIRLNIPFIFIILIAAIAVLIAYYLYRRTTPEISRIFKYVLVTIRSVILFFVILLFFTPNFLLTYKEINRPTIALFIDNSKSMGYETESKNR